MYKIPSEFNIDNLEGELIIQIAFGLNYITFFFSKGFIQLSGSFSIDFNSQNFEYDEVYPVNNDFGLLKLLEKMIMKAIINEHRNILTLVFEDQITLKLIGNDEYESYRIKINADEFIV